MATIDGTNGDDVLYTLAAGDIVNGLDGNDSLYATFGFATLDGGAGNDFLAALSDGNTLFAGEGNDRLWVGQVFGSVIAHENVLHGGNGDDRITVWQLSASNVVNGDDGDDLIAVEIGFDNLANGGAGNDQIYVTGGHNVGDGGEGDDLLYLIGGDNTLRGGGGNDLLTVDFFGSTNNMLDGGAGDDHLLVSGEVPFPLEHGNTVVGGSGNDTIVVETGGNLLMSGDASDSDVFVLRAYGNTITDFDAAGPGSPRGETAEDVLDITEVLFGQTEALPYLPLPQAAAHGYLIVDSSSDVGGGAANDTVIMIDADGSSGPGTPVLLVTLLDVTLGVAGFDGDNWSNPPAVLFV